MIEDVRVHSALPLEDTVRRIRSNLAGVRRTPMPGLGVRLGVGAPVWVRGSASHRGVDLTVLTQVCYVGSIHGAFVEHSEGTEIWCSVERRFLYVPLRYTFLSGPLMLGVLLAGALFLALPPDGVVGVVWRLTLLVGSVFTAFQVLRRLYLEHGDASIDEDVVVHVLGRLLAPGGD